MRRSRRSQTQRRVLKGETTRSRGECKVLQIRFSRKKLFVLTRSRPQTPDRLVYEGRQKQYSGSYKGEYRFRRCDDIDCVSSSLSLTVKCFAQPEAKANEEEDEDEDEASDDEDFGKGTDRLCTQSPL
jgi:hypothetical protein